MLVMCWLCVGDVLVTPWRCLGKVFGDVLAMYFGCVLAMCWRRDGDVSACVDNVLAMCW